MIKFEAFGGRGLKKRQIVLTHLTTLDEYGEYICISNISRDRGTTTWLFKMPCKKHVWMNYMLKTGTNVQFPKLIYGIHKLISIPDTPVEDLRNI